MLSRVLWRGTQSFEECGQVAVCGVEPVGRCAAMDVDGVGDAAHERDEVGGGQVTSNRPGVARPVEECGADRLKRLFEFRGARQGVGGCGGDRSQGRVRDLRFEGAQQEGFERAPGIGVGQRLRRPWAARASRQGVATVSSSASGVAKWR